MDAHGAVHHRPRLGMRAQDVLSRRNAEQAEHAAIVRLFLAERIHLLETAFTPHRHHAHQLDPGFWNRLAGRMPDRPAEHASAHQRQTQVANLGAVGDRDWGAGAPVLRRAETRDDVARLARGDDITAGGDVPELEPAIVTCNHRVTVRLLDVIQRDDGRAKWRWCVTGGGHAAGQRRGAGRRGPRVSRLLRAHRRRSNEDTAQQREQDADPHRITVKDTDGRPPEATRIRFAWRDSRSSVAGSRQSRSPSLAMAAIKYSPGGIASISKAPDSSGGFSTRRRGVSP